MTMLQLTSHSVKQFLAQKSFIEMEHPPCSPDFVQKDFWLFQKIVCLKGTKILGY